MRDTELLEGLLNADSEDAVVEILEQRGLLGDAERWRYLGDTPNNQSVVNNQQSTAMAALVEKYTNAADAILLRRCRASGVDPRADEAPASMKEAVQAYFGDFSTKNDLDRRSFSEDHLLLYATGSKTHPCLWLYDNGEGQLAEKFPETFCSLISGTKGSYKGSINFVQGRFNMGGTGVLPFCGERHKLQLVVSRVPEDVAGGSGHEWAFTIMCFFPSQGNPSWRYLVGDDTHVLTAGTAPLSLVPRKNAKSGVVCVARERKVQSGTLIKMYDFKAPKSNICGELFKKLSEYLVQPMMPLRIMECRKEYKANVMGVTLWDRLGDLVKKNELEEGSENGIGVVIELSSKETVPVEIRVFKSSKKKKGAEVDEMRVGLRALINGQSHAKRGPSFFRTKKVDKEHIAGSMLVTLDCTMLGQQSRNELFMANREQFRDSPLKDELFKELETQLRRHALLAYLNKKRYEEKVVNAIDDKDGLKAIQELLSSNKELAALFGSKESGEAGSKTAPVEGDTKKIEKPEPFSGSEFPSYFHRADGTTAVEISIPRGGLASASFQTDVRNDYFTRSKNVGTCEFSGDLTPSYGTFNGRLVFTCRAPKNKTVESQLHTKARITDDHGSGPFDLEIHAKIVHPKKKKKRKKSTPKSKKAQAGTSLPKIREILDDPDKQTIVVARAPGSTELEIHINMKDQTLLNARAARPQEEESAVNFVFKYGLALLAMARIKELSNTPKWQDNESDCRDEVGSVVSSFAGVITSLCLDLAKKIPKAL